MMLRNALFIVILGILSCGSQDLTPVATSVEVKFCNTQINDKIYKKDGQTLLWAGVDSSTHFNITGMSLDVCNFHDYGYNRETIPSLIGPEYAPIFDKPDHYDDDEPVIILDSGNGDIKVFPYGLMISHEVINEQVGDDPVMIVYCFLADLAAVYTRNYCGQIFTFAASGYTYSETEIWNGIEAFVLWDRETESLWWPMTNSGVSGVMKDVRLDKYDADKWFYLTWGEAKEQYPNAMVLQSDPDWEAVGPWGAYGEGDLECL